jgi:hypothetical protein
VRQPGPPLAAVDAEALQPFLNVLGEHPRPTTLIVEDEHPDASRLAIATRGEADRSGRCRSVAQDADDRLDLATGPMAEERERDVQVLSPNDANACELRALPPLDLVEDVIGQAQREEEP